MGRGKQIIFSTVVCLILLVSVFGCAAEQTTLNSVPTTMKPPSETGMSPKATSTIYIVPNPPTRTPTIRPSPLDGVDPVTGCPKNRYVSDEEFLSVIGPFNTPRHDEAAKPVFSQDRISKLINTFGAGPFIKYVREHKWEHYGFPEAQQLDLTGDGVPELFVRWVDSLIYGCSEGEYKLLFEFEGLDMSSYATDIHEVKDGNRNQILEVIFDHGGSFSVFEYSDGQFRNIMGPDGLYLDVQYEGDASFRDFNGDGVSEVYVYSGIAYGDIYGQMLPWRKEWDTYSWNGKNYILSRRDFTAPEYRFQSAYDGDRSTLYGEYAKALSFYQDVIFSDKLGWWSAERDVYVWELYRWDYPEPTPVPPESDPDEYEYLAAYARFRIMLLYLLQGWDSDAQVVYKTLKEKYPEGNPGSIYAELATVFLEEYQVSGEMGASCIKVINAADKEEALKYIGVGGDLGTYHMYTVEDICPFE
jgi:hypothetical protein